MKNIKDVDKDVGIIANQFDQLYEATGSCIKTISQAHPTCENAKKSDCRELERLKYELSNEEINALLG